MEEGEIIAPWETIGSAIKYFGGGLQAFDYVMWEISWTNVQMLMACIPVTDLPSADKKEDIVEEVEGFDGMEDFFKQ